MGRSACNYDHPAIHPFCGATDIDTWGATAFTVAFTLALFLFG